MFSPRHFVHTGTGQFAGNRVNKESGTLCGRWQATIFRAKQN
ncbi:hypothetical protein QPK13_23940 [Photorhabdus tasmaniensis]|nr:hypothetical protein [Photorhabdus tasmaniensis]